MSWSNVLETYAKMKDPEKQLPPGVHLISDEHTLAIFDGYEKAKYHFLIMPRDPFKLGSGTTDPFKLASGGTPSSVPPSHLSSLHALLKSPHASAVLKAIKVMGERVKKMVEDEMMKNEGWVWDVMLGFHASESMKHVHLHVISKDLISDRLKNKKHYNSFHPDLGFFLHLDDVIAQVDSGNITVYKKTTAAYEALWKEPLQSFYTSEQFSQLPKLKVHLVEQWEKAGRQAKAAKGKRKSEAVESGAVPDKKAKT